MTRDVDLLRIELGVIWRLDERGRLPGPEDMVFGVAADGIVAAVSAGVPDPLADRLLDLAARGKPSPFGTPPDVLEDCRALLGGDSVSVSGGPSYAVNPPVRYDVPVEVLRSDDPAHVRRVRPLRPDNWEPGEWDELCDGGEGAPWAMIVEHGQTTRHAEPATHRETARQREPARHEQAPEGGHGEPATHGEPARQGEPARYGEPARHEQAPEGGHIAGHEQAARVSGLAGGRQVVAICHSARNTPAGAEAGTWTSPAYRGRGYAAITTAAWAELLPGIQLFYSTSADNHSSQRVAARLGLRGIGWLWKLTV
ncbi:GNAT family N-acetyltransferase [Nonomuraea insulae]|uniref:GNAT family N-acetyltransferase n=1 Tax=Nonomuraea insulae TaxID=1616787 RepID=A0ABW1CLC3_9ACTN